MRRRRWREQLALPRKDVTFRRLPYGVLAAHEDPDYATVSYDISTAEWRSEDVSWVSIAMKIEHAPGVTPSLYLVGPGWSCYLLNLDDRTVTPVREDKRTEIVGQPEPLPQWVQLMVEDAMKNLAGDH